MIRRRKIEMRTYRNDDLDKEQFILDVISPLVAQLEGVGRATSYDYIGKYGTYRKVICIIANDGTTIKEIDYMGRNLQYIVKAVYEEFIKEYNVD